MKLRLTTTAIAVAAVFPLSVPIAVAQESRLETVVVTATRQAQRVDQVLARVDVIERDEIERAGNKTLVELLSGRPGVQVASNGGAGSSASVFIRGANANQTLLLIDGMRIGSATLGSPSFENIPLALIERIEILRGPASFMYGADAIGGVVQVFTRRDVSGVTPRLNVGAGSWDSYTAGAGVAGSVERWRFNLDVGHDRSRGFDAIPESKKGTDADRDGWRNDYANMSVALGFRARDEVGFSFWQTDGRNWYDNGQNFNSYLNKASLSVSAHVRNEIAEGWFSTLRFGQSNDSSHDKSTNAPATEFDTTQRQLTWQNDIDLAGGSLLLAYERLVQSVDSTTNYDESRRTINSVLAGWGRNFGQHDIQINARRDRSSQFGGKNTGSLAYGYWASDTLRLTAGVGTAFRAPSFNQLYFPGFGNPDLKPERALNRELGISWDNGVSGVDITYFNNRIRELIAGFPATNIDPKLEGVELGLRTVWGGFDISAGWDWLNARNTDNQNWLPRRSRHSGFARAETDFGHWRWGVEATGQGKRFNDAANKQKLPGYALVNIYADYRFAQDWRLEARANNVFDKAYVLTQNFSALSYSAPRANVFVGIRYVPQ